jgi:iron-sulfur cluster repair protein YtfE (RIC family)
MPSNALIVVHKFIRCELFELANQIARAGADDVEAVAGALDTLCQMLEGHAAKEDEGLAPQLDEATAARMMADHVLLDDQLEQLRERAHALLPCDAATREARLTSLGLDFHAFVAAYLRHLDDEERTMLPLLDGRVPPVAAVAVNAASLPPDERSAFLAKLLARVSPSERKAIERTLAEARDAAE